MENTYSTLAAKAISEDWGTRRIVAECEAAGLDREELQYTIDDQVGLDTRQYKGVDVDHTMLAR